MTKEEQINSEIVKLQIEIEYKKAHIYMAKKEIDATENVLKMIDKEEAKKPYLDSLKNLNDQVTQDTLSIEYCEKIIENLKTL